MYSSDFCDNNGRTSCRDKILKLMRQLLPSLLGSTCLKNTHCGRKEKRNTTPQGPQPPPLSPRHHTEPHPAVHCLACVV